MSKYTIYRFYGDPKRERKLIKTGLTLKQAQEHCSDPETSSKTHPKGRNGVKCDWFDGYTQYE